MVTGLLGGSLNTTLGTTPKKKKPLLSAPSSFPLYRSGCQIPSLKWQSNLVWTTPFLFLLVAAAGLNSKNRSFFFLPFPFLAFLRAGGTLLSLFYVSLYIYVHTHIHSHTQAPPRCPLASPTRNEFEALHKTWHTHIQTHTHPRPTACPGILQRRIYTPSKIHSWRHRQTYTHTHTSTRRQC